MPLIGRTANQCSKAASKVARQILGNLKSIAEVLGILQTPSTIYRERTKTQRLKQIEKTNEEIELLIQERNHARKNKIFEKADQIRKELDSWNIEVADSMGGSTWRIGI